jgi:ribulose-phosphate 3-epimerase
VGWLEWTAGTPQVEPSIYAADFARLGEQLDELLEAGARIFHFDVGDGHFVPEITIGPVVLRAISERVHSGGGVLDCHLMVSDPSSQLERIAEAGGDSVTFHVEAVDDVRSVGARARAFGLGVGIAFNPETDVARAAEAVAAAEADIALCMGIHPGLSGQVMLDDTPARLAHLRASVSDTVMTQVDGGVTDANVAALRAAGADLVVAGSAVFWQGSPGASYRALTEAVTEVRA